MEISITPFRFKYLKALHDLLSSNDYPAMDTVTMKTLPKTGYIALMNGHPIAAGFLRRVEGGYAQIDTLTSNKFFGAQVRNAGINKVVDALMEDAKTLRLKGVIAFTRDKSIITRAEERGFHSLEHTVLALSLKE